MDSTDAHLAPRVSTYVRLPHEGATEEKCESMRNASLPPSSLRQRVLSGRERNKASAAVIQSFAYDWTARYDTPEYKRITGYYKSKTEKESANAFLTLRGEKGDVEIVWKVSSGNSLEGQDPTWLGHDGQPAANAYDGSGSTGFIVLAAPPQEAMRLQRTSGSAIHP